MRTPPPHDFFLFLRTKIDDMVWTRPAGAWKHRATMYGLTLLTAFRLPLYDALMQMSCDPVMKTSPLLSPFMSGFVAQAPVAALLISSEGIRAKTRSLFFDVPLPHIPRFQLVPIILSSLLEAVALGMSMQISETLLCHRMATMRQMAAASQNTTDAKTLFRGRQPMLLECLVCAFLATMTASFVRAFGSGMALFSPLVVLSSLPSTFLIAGYSYSRARWGPRSFYVLEGVGVGAD